MIEKEKTFPDILGNRNGMKLDMTIDNNSIGMHEQFDSIDLHRNESEKMLRGTQPEVFDNNGGTNKGEAGGVINKNGEYGPITYGF